MYCSIDFLSVELDKFKPELPKEKVDACNRLGVGIVERVILKFSEPFWKGLAGEVDFFGRVPATATNRGMFPIFYDLSQVLCTLSKKFTTYFWQAKFSQLSFEMHWYYSRQVKMFMILV